MLNFEGLIVNIIFILFPSLLHTIYTANKQILKESENYIVLDFTITFSLLLILIYNKFFNTNYILYYFLILLMLSFIKKRGITSLIISIISLEYLAFNYNFNNILLIILFAGNIIIYFLIRKKEKYPIILFYIFSIIISFIIYYSSKDFNLLYFIINSIILYLMLLVLIVWLKKSKEILELQNVLKEYKKQKQLKESLFKITHEIKNPLAVVKGYLSMLNIDNKEKALKYIGIIKSEVERTVNLLEDFMQFSKIQLKCEKFNYNILLEEIKNLVIPLFESKGIKYEFKSEEKIFIKGDFLRLKQVIVNIIKNSVEACDKNGVVYITCFIDQKFLNIIIKDNGVGMNKETLNKILTPFYTTKEKGTGLGVCLSREIIEAHKGKLIYTSSLGKGTTAKIVLPILN